MLMLIGLILFIYWVTEKHGSDIGGLVLLIVLAVLIVIGLKLVGDQNKAYYNFVKDWKKRK